MLVYIFRRILLSGGVLLILLALVFCVFRLIPGDPALLMLGKNPSAESLSALRGKFGLDQPLPIQFVKWLDQALHGDLGSSRIGNQSVVSLITQKFALTVELTTLAMVIGCGIGFPLGVLSALKRDTPLDVAARVASLLGFSIPNYWLAILLVILFSLQLGWLPVAGYISPFDDLGQHLRYLVLPALTLGLPIAAEQMRFVRASMLEVMRQDYIRTAWAKGLRSRTIVLKHALKNALIPFVTVVGLQCGYMLGGSVIIEQIFSWPGIGWLTYQSITFRDYAVVQGTVLLGAVGFLSINLLVDIGYVWLNHRVRLEE